MLPLTVQNKEQKKLNLKKSYPLTSSFAQLSAAESHASHSCVWFGFLGLGQSSLEPGFWGFESGLFQLWRVNRELA
jgi:hypothetical protein